MTNLSICISLGLTFQQLLTKKKALIRLAFAFRELWKPVHPGIAGEHT